MTPELNHSKHVNPSKDWANYGDVNPRRHGGRFIHWTGEKWVLIVTRQWRDIAPDMDSDDPLQLFQIYHIYKDDIFEGGDPSNGPTAAMESALDSLNVAYETALVDYDIEYWVADMEHHALLDPSQKDVENHEYWETLESYGVPVDEFQ